MKREKENVNLGVPNSLRLMKISSLRTAWSALLGSTQALTGGRRRGLGKGTIIAEVMDGDVVGRCGRELADGSMVPMTGGARPFVTLPKLPDGPLAIQDRDHAGADGDAAAAPPASAAAAPGADGDAAAAPPASAAAAPAAANNRAPPKPQVPPESMVL